MENEGKWAMPPGYVVGHRNIKWGYSGYRVLWVFSPIFHAIFILLYNRCLEAVGTPTLEYTTLCRLWRFDDAEQLRVAMVPFVKHQRRQKAGEPVVPPVAEHPDIPAHWRTRTYQTQNRPSQSDQVGAIAPASERARFGPPSE